MPPFAKLGCGFLAVAAALVLLAIVVGHSSRENDKRIEAFTMCETFVKRQLKAPSTAVFGSFHDSQAVGSGNGPYTVQGYVDSQNSFGAMLRSQYSCSVQAVGGDKWTLLALDLD